MYVSLMLSILKNQQMTIARSSLKKENIQLVVKLIFFWHFLNNLHMVTAYFNTKQHSNYLIHPYKFLT